MTREKTGSDVRRVIIDLSWPKEHSVNAGIDKNSYLNSDFALQFATVDHIISELVEKKVGRGAHLCKIDMSRAFCHIKVDPVDYDLLGLYWNSHYVETCLPLGSQHKTIFQCIIESVRYIVRKHCYKVMNYVDDFFGVGMLCDAYSVLAMQGSHHKCQKIDCSWYKIYLFSCRF